jgi:aerotolerance regulator-like protein
VIGWLNPAALVGLIAVAGPILVHFLRRQRAARIAFPSLRFIDPSRTAAVRLRVPSDLLLLVVRLGIVALAAAALAQPVVVTGSRLGTWNARVARAVVVDGSDSMRAADGQARTAAFEATEAAESESAGAGRLVRLESSDMRAGLRQAVARLSTMPPARREIVVISDFQLGALTAADLDLVPGNVGLRFVRVGTSPQERRFDGTPVFGADRLARSEVRLTAGRTALSVVAGGSSPEGLRVIASGHREDVIRALVRTVATAGAPAPSGQEPMAFSFSAGVLPQRVAAVEAPGSTASSSTVRRVAAGWMLRTVLRLRDDPDAAALAGEVDASQSLADDRPWFVVFRDRQQRPLVRVASAGAELVFEVASQPTSLMAAAILRGALGARAGSTARPEQEVQMIPAAELATWSRAAAPVSSDAWRRVGSSDARWVWGAVLVALGAESALRRERRPGRQEARTDAA